MKILLVSEGKHELALGQPECALGELVRRVLGRDVEFERKEVSDPAVRIHMRPGKWQNYERRVVGWLKYAADAGFDALVLLIDRDGDADRDTGIASAQETPAVALPRALGVAKNLSTLGC